MREGMKMMKNEKYMNVAELKANINRLNALVEMQEEAIFHQNYLLLKIAIQDLEDGVGNFYESTYWAPNRVYVEENGIKNVRFGHSRSIDQTENKYKVIEVKVTSPKGLQIPEEMVVRGERYIIDIIYSQNYSDYVDY